MDKKSLEKLYNITKGLSVLYVEDDKVLQNNFTLLLEDLFYNVDSCDNGFLGLKQYKEYYLHHQNYYDLVITDIKMPLMNGVDLVKSIRSLHPDQKIIVTSAHDDSTYLIEFIDLGISKFIKKPFEFSNFMSFFLNILENEKNTNIYINENIIWDNNKSILYKNSQEELLSYSEQQILKLFINNPHQIFSKYDILHILQEDSWDIEISEDSVKSMIKRLRKKLPVDMIQNIYAKGYKFVL